MAIIITNTLLGDETSTCGSGSAFSKYVCQVGFSVGTWVTWFP